MDKKTYNSYIEDALSVINFDSIYDFTCKLEQSSPQKYKKLESSLSDYYNNKITHSKMYSVISDLVGKKSNLVDIINKNIVEDIKIPKINYNEIAEEIFQQIFQIILKGEYSNFKIILNYISEYATKNSKSIENNDQIFSKIKYIFDQNAIKKLLSFSDLNEINELIAYYKENKNPIIDIENNISFLKTEESENEEPEKNTKKDNNDAEFNINLLKNEANMFAYLSNILSESDYNNLCKIIQLYILSIISYNELFILGEPIFNKIDEKIVLIFKDIMENKELIKLKKNKFYNVTQQLNTTDNPSYSILVNNNFLSKNENINNNYVFNNHHTNLSKNFENLIKKKYIKNTHEENLLRLENERFEFDLSISQLRYIILLLQKIKNNSNDKDIIESCLLRMKNFEVFEVIFSNFKPGVVEYNILNAKNNENNINSMIEYIDNKLKEAMELKSKQDKDIWENECNNNFYKALDVKTYNIKLFERSHLTNKYLLEEDNGILNHHKYRTKKEIKKYIFNNLNYYHSVKQLTHINNSANIDQQNVNNVEALKDIYKINRNIPINVIKFDDNSSLSEAYSILLFYIKNNSKLISEEKEFITKSVNYLFLEKIKIKETEAYKLKELNKSEFENLQIIKNNNNNILNCSINISTIKNNILNKLSDNTPNCDDSSYNKIALRKRENCLKNKKIISNESNYDNIKLRYISSNYQTKNNVDICYYDCNIYLIYKYFYYIYERIKLAKELLKDNIKLENINGDLYDNFITILLNYLTGKIEYSHYEDIVKIYFNSHAGVFLNFDKILSYILKIIPSENIIYDYIKINNECNNNIKYFKISYKLFEQNQLRIIKNNNILLNNLDKVYKFIYINDTIFIYRIKSNYSGHNLKQINTNFEYFIKKSNEKISTELKDDLIIKKEDTKNSALLFNNIEYTVC